MQALAFAYPIAVDMQGEHRQAFYEFLKSLETLIPCKHCRKHYAEWRADVASSPASPIFDGRAALSEAIVALHNDVRRQQGKSTRLYSEVKERYTGSKSSCPVGTVEVKETAGDRDADGDGNDESFGSFDHFDHTAVVVVLILVVVCSAAAAVMCSKCRNR